jgi:hypothetical protein
MDDMNVVGRFGTISLVRRNTLETVTSYPVDDERTTFGRSVIVLITTARRIARYNIGSDFYSCSHTS